MSNSNIPELVRCYNDFLNHNKRFWESFAPPISELVEDYILVDLMCEHPQYILSTLTAAKYLQKRTKLRLIGVARSQTHLDRIAGIVDTFSLESIFFVDYTATLKSGPQVSFLENLAQETDIEKIRRAITGFSIDGVVIGDFIYDSYLKNYIRPTVESVDDDLVHMFNVGVTYFDVFSKIFKGRKIVYTVQGHTVYLYYGMLASIALHYHSIVYACYPGTSPMTLKRYDDLKTLKRYVNDIADDDFDYIQKHHSSKAIQYAKQYLENRFQAKPMEGADPHIYESFGPDKKRYSTDEFDRQLQLDHKKPNVFIMSHVLYDAPHGDDRMLHNDYFEWLTDTLEKAAEIAQVNWIVKPHPDCRYYLKNGNDDTEKYSAEKIDDTILLTMAYVEKCDHIFLAPEDLHTASIENIADAIVTVRGSAVLEFSALGIPCIVTGKAPFTGFGFTIEPETLDEYDDILKNVHNYRRLTPEQREKALICCYMYFYLNMVDCRFIPNLSAAHWCDINMIAYWKSLVHAIHENTVDDDPLYKNFNTFFVNNLPQLMKYDEIARDTDAIGT